MHLRTSASSVCFLWNIVKLLAPVYDIPAAKMAPLFMMFAGGPLGSGQQWY